MTTTFNLDVGIVVRHWLSLTVEYGAVLHYVLGHDVGQSLGVFYVDDGILGSWDPEWLQVALNVLIGLLQIIDLTANINKSKTMTCYLGVIISGMSQETGGIRPAQHWGGIYITGTPEEMCAMPRLQGGYENQIPDSPLMISTWYQATNQLGKAVSKTELTPTPGLQGRIPLGHHKVTFPLTRLPRVVSLQKRPPEPLQYDALAV